MWLLLWQQKVRDKEIMTRIGTTWDLVHEIMAKKLNLLGHICRMPDYRLLKQVVLE